MAPFHSWLTSSVSAPRFWFKQNLSQEPRLAGTMYVTSWVEVRKGRATFFLIKQLLHNHSFGYSIHALSPHDATRHQETPHFASSTSPHICHPFRGTV